MKKLLDSKFLFIIALSVIALIILGVGAFYLFDDSDDVFVKDGYILNPLSAKNEKYLFDKNATYKENLSGMVVFNDADNNEVSVFKDSFLHYMDSSLSFLTNGAILDLDSISGTDAVKFYNITNKSIVNRNGDGYVIETNGEDINLKNFIGRISDNKYIVAGSLETKIPGNEKNITGNYFEIVYNDEGVITIENSEVKYQVAAEGTYIYAGDITIDLGNKKIVKDKEDVMSITAITINGDENIEIIPKEIEKENDDNNGNNNQQNVIFQDNTGNGQNDGNGDNTSNDTDAREDVKYEDLVVSLKDYEIFSTAITLVFDTINQREDDVLIMRVTDLNTGKTADRIYDVEKEQEIRVRDLNPDTNYLFTIVNERNENKYYQNILKTKSFGISLEQTYITSSEAGYKITLDDDSEIQDADITLIAYDENENKYDYDNAITRHLSEYANPVTGEYEEIIFNDLKSDTIYTVTLDGYVINSIRKEKVYNLTNTTLTLKEEPIIGGVSREIKEDGFKLFIDNIVDKDSAIQNYTYYIFANDEGEDVNTFSFDSDNYVTKFTKSSAEPVELKVGENNIKSNQNYIYMVAIEYYDNEKYIEKVYEGRVDMVIGDDPIVSIQKDQDYISYDRIGAAITIVDNSCFIAMEKRDCFDDYENYPVVIDVKEKNANGNLIKIDGYPTNISDFAANGNTLRKELKIDGLKPGTTYVISVTARRKDKPDDGIKPLKTGSVYDFEIDTKNLANFKAIWNDKKNGDDEYPVTGTFKLDKLDNDYSISSDFGAELIEKIVFKLYDGRYTNNSNFANQKLLATSKTYTKEEGLKEKFYSNEFEITNDLFGIKDVKDLRELTKSVTGIDRLSPYYTIAVEAYYANDAKIYIEGDKGSFAVPAYLTNDVKDAKINAKEIWKSETDNFSNLLTIGEGGAVVGYELFPSYDKDGYEVSGMNIDNITIYVYDDSKAKAVSFYLNDSGKDPVSSIVISADKVADAIKNGVKIYMDNGVENGAISNVMTRGKKYYIREQINYVVDETKGQQLSDFEEVMAKKETPVVKVLYIDETTKDGSVTYKYRIVDIDNAWYSENGEYNIYYKIGNGEEKKVSIARNLDNLNTFKISGLAKGEDYTLTYNRNNYDTGNNDIDVEAGILIENRLYEGFYDIKDSKYNVKYKVINDPQHDNKVTFKVSPSDDILDDMFYDMLDRILYYNITLTDGVNTYTDKKWDLVKCADDSETDKNRCFEIPYLNLINKKDKSKSMKSEGDQKKYITAKVEVKYDNGLMGYSYINDIGENKTYPYMVMQDDSTSDKIGNYFVINSNALYTTPSAIGSRKYPIGYYNFNLNTQGSVHYVAKFLNDSFYDIPYNLSNPKHYGYYVNQTGSMNPKMVSTYVIPGSDNTFYFSSITPTINLDKTVSLINGARVMMTLDGADIDDFCADGEGNECKQNGTKKLYIQVLDDETLDTVNKDNKISEVVAKTFTIDLTEGNINGQHTLDIINLLHDHDYYFKVFAYLNDGGVKKLTEIFNKANKNKPETYAFSTKKLYIADEAKRKNGILNNLSVSPRSKEDGNYNDKELVTKIDLNPYDTEMNIPYGIDVSYEFCSDIECTHKIIEKDVDTIAKNMISYDDITDADLIYGSGQDYYMNVYFTYNYDEKDESGVWVTKQNRAKVFDEGAKITFDPLKPLTFEVFREADYDPDNGGYVVDITVNLDDESKILKNGKFYVKLLDGDEVVGNLMLQDENGIFKQVGETGKYDKIALEADDKKEHNLNQKIRIGGLEPNTSYTVVVFGDVHMKNAGLDEYDFEVRSGKDGTGDLVYTTNNYGIAFGSVTYRLTLNGLIARYGYGSNVDALHIKTIEVDVKEDGRPFYNNLFVLGENGKYLDYNQKLGRYRFLVEYDENGNKKNNDVSTYQVITRYEIYDRNTDETVWIKETTEGYGFLSQPQTFDPDEVIEDE